MFLFHSILISNTTFLPFPLIWRWPFSRTLCHIISHISHSTYHLFNTLLLLSICLLTYQEIKILSGQEMCPFCSPQCFRLESGIRRTQYIFIEWTNDNCKIKWLGNHVLLRGDFKLLDDPWEEKPIVIDKTLRKHQVLSFQKNQKNHVVLEHCLKSQPAQVLHSSQALLPASASYSRGCESDNQYLLYITHLAKI